MLNEMTLDVCDPVASRYQQCLDQNGHQVENRRWQKNYSYL